MNVPPLTGRIVFFLLLAWFLMGLLRGAGGTLARPRSRASRAFYALLFCAFVGVFLYQGTWQLGGFARPEFVEFLKRYNRRPDNSVKTRVRGRILDRNGAALAHDDPEHPLARVYPLGPATGHLVGYRHPLYGMAGVEAADDAYLEGATTATPEERERFGRNLLKRDGLLGNDLVLTIDARLQQEATRLMQGHSGAAVVLDPRCGDILALVSAPSLDPNRLVPGLFAEAHEKSPLLNRATQGLYPPGSTFKIVVAALALERGLEPVFDCPAGGFIPAANQPAIRDHEYYAALRTGRAWNGHGRIGLGRALAKSSNVYFAQLGVHLGGEAIEEGARLFLLNTNLTLLEGSTGALRFRPGSMPALRPGDRGSAAQVAIGQGELLATPLGMAMIAAAIANDGQLLRPRLVARGTPDVLSTPLSASAARKLRGLMRAVVTDGTGRGADLPGLQVAGKTGTAQSPRGADHAWFVCFAPADRPALVVAVLIEHGGFGAAAAVPVAVGILKKASAIGLLGAPPERRP